MTSNDAANRRTQVGAGLITPGRMDMSNMKLASYEIEEIKAEIATLEKRERTLIGSDAGTHGKPLTHRIYEEISGERYATASFAGSNATRCTEQSALDNTEG